MFYIIALHRFIRYFRDNSEKKALLEGTQAHADQNIKDFDS